ncbi:MAG: response regulator [Nitrospinae bacterium]|nr:response regulator [Nitrospinota bacterium]
MGLLQNFRSRDFIEQTRTLNEIEKGNKSEEIPGLFDLHENPLNDRAVDSMVIHTLRSLLSKNEEATVRGISSEKSHVRKLCIHMAGENRFASAGPVLMNLMQREKDQDAIFEILSSLSKIRVPESLDVFRKNARHPDQVIAALCVETLGLWEDMSSLGLFTEIIEEGGREGKYEECDLLTWNAIKAVAALRSDAGLALLTSKITHPGPGARRIIHQELVEKGREAIPFLSSVFLEEDVDARIHAAQLLGMIKDRKAGEVLIGALESGAADHPNIKYNLYESLGKLPIVKGIDYLLDALSKEDGLVLLAVVAAINNRVSSRATEKLAELITAGDERGEKIINAIVVSKALNIFEALYENKAVSEKLLVAIPRIKDPMIITAFRAKLKSMKTGVEMSDAVGEKIPTVLSRKAGKRILAVDDSRLMLFFYRTAASKIGYDITTAINGHEAWDILEKGEEYDLIVTDLNMPVMDGVEFTRKVRGHATLGKIPIIMATTESKQSQVDLAKKVGVSDFIQKPFTEEALQKKVQALLTKP